MNLILPDPPLFGYDSVSNKNNFQFSVDVRSMMVAASVNVGLTRNSTLSLIPRTNFTLWNPSSNTTYFGAKYTHPKFQGMTPIVCYGDGHKYFFCMVKICSLFIKNFPSPFTHLHLAFFLCTDCSRTYFYRSLFSALRNQLIPARLLQLQQDQWSIQEMQRVQLSDGTDVLQH